MNPPQHSRSERAEPNVDTARPIAISHIVHTLRSYAPAILLAVVGVSLLYTIAALAYYLTGPTERVTTLPFRLDFEGAPMGTYPNGMKFSPAEIVSSQVLLRVYNANNLDRYLSFPDFSRSLFVLESNPALERLATEYQARLSDPKLTSVERERIQKEFDLKRESVAKNEYAISYTRDVTGRHLPEQLVRKVLGDVLTTWADVATKEQHVTKYEVSLLSPRFLDPTPVEQADTVVAVQVLRSKTLRVMTNISELLGLPAARLARTKDNLTLMEARLRLDEIMRFRLEPLVPLAVTSGGLTNPSRTISFIETQLAHDQRQLASRQAGLTAMREALLMYFTNQAGHAKGVAEAAGGAETAPSQPSNDRSSVTPQLSESFIDRLLTLTSNAADIAYRQQMIDNYRKAAQDVIPLQEAVAYDTHVLEELRSARGVGGAANDAAVRAQIESIRADVRAMIGTLHELHEAVSANLNPATELFTITSPPYTRVHRSRALPRLMLIGVFVVLASLLAACLGALLHRRVLDEEEEEGYVQEEQTA